MCQCFGNTPTMLIKSSGNCVSLDAGPDRPVCYAQSFSVVGQVASFARVQYLLPLCCPSAVARFVIAVIVNTVNRVFRGWFRSHILVKGEKGIAPTVADGNAATSVITVPRIIDVCASLDHASPSAMFRREVQPIDFTGTAARLMAAIAKHCASYINFVSAFALAEPASSLTAKSGKRYDCQFSVDVASLVFNVLRQWSRMTRRHDSTPCKLCCVRSAGRLQSSGCSHYYALLFDQMQSVTLCHKNPGRQVQHISQA